MTADKDFGELVYRLGRVHHGVLLLRLEGLSPSTKATVVADSLKIHGFEFAGQFAVITPHSVRIR